MTQEEIIAFERGVEAEEVQAESPQALVKEALRAHNASDYTTEPTSTYAEQLAAERKERAKLEERLKGIVAENAAARQAGVTLATLVLKGSQ